MDEQIAEIDELNAVTALFWVLSNHHVRTEQTYTSCRQRLQSLSLTKLCDLCCRQAMLFKKKQAAVDEQIAEIDKLNAVINAAERDMLKLRKVGLLQEPMPLRGMASV